MGTGEWLEAIGLICQAIGLVLTATGLAETYEEFGGGSAFLPYLVDPVIGAVRGGWSRFAGWVRRPFGAATPANGSAESAGAHVRAARARAHVGFTPIDHSDTIAALRRLEDNLNQLNEREQDAVDRLEDELEESQREIAAVRAELARAMAESRTRDAEMATGGLRRAMLGLIVNAFGLVFTAAGLAIR